MIPESFLYESTIIVYGYLMLQNRISSYSYVKGKWIYLETDCDYSIFLDTIS